MKRAAVILCGSGFKDGSEIRESVAVLWALSVENVEAHCFALSQPQSDVVNCLTGQAEPGEKRNQLVEAARIARGAVRPLSELQAKDFDFLVIPGGFGVAKNLCSFATQGSGGKVQPEVKRVIEGFRDAGKPIGAVCIAPAAVAMALPGSAIELTVGEKSEASGEIEKLGHRHVVKSASQWHTDRKNKIVSTPAYMYDEAPLKDVFTGVHGLVHDLCAL
ncbi:MAG TPA: isoprenoid biosynthesis glyoxalase ElbB [Bdellovibrionota bacterium]|jgi:enhancing lycopene biosynthesis protein 2